MASTQSSLLVTKLHDIHVVGALLAGAVEESIHVVLDDVSGSAAVSTLAI